MAVPFKETSRLSSTVLAASVLAGVALWLSFGVLAVRETDSARIGILPSFLVLALCVSIALVAAAAADMSPRASLPLFFSILIVLPWLPVPVPTLLLVWTGPAVMFAWLAIVVCRVTTVAQDRARSMRMRWLLSERRAPAVAAVLAFAAFIGLRLATVGPPGGDEPHYLVITQSMLQDGDIKVANNYEAEDYLRYWGGFLRPHYSQPSRSGALYSVHAPGVPALVAPAFRVAGYRGVVVWVAVLVAAGSAFVWRAGYALTRDARAAWFGWSAVALTAPVALHGTLVYPDAIGGALLALGTYALVIARNQARNEATPSHASETFRWRAPLWLLTGIAMGALPWLHTRLAVPAACLGGALLLRLATMAWRGRARWLDVAVFAVPAAIGAASWLAFFHVLYGTMNPSSAYGDQIPIDGARIGIGFAGLLADQEFGLLPNAPIHVLCAAGLWLLFRRDRRVSIELLLTVVPYVAATSAFPMWWAGAAPPARFLVPIIFPLGLALAALWASQDATRRAMSSALLGLSIAVAAGLTIGGDRTLGYNDTDGRAKLLDWLAPVVDLPAAFPSYFRGDLLLPAAVWGVAMLMGFLLFRWFSRSVHEHFMPLLAMGCLIGVFAIATSVTWLFDGGTHIAFTRSQLRLLRADNSGWHSVGLRLPRISVFHSDQARARLTMFTSPLDAPHPSALLSLPDVPPGDYMLRVTRRSANQGDVGIRVGRGTGVLWQWPVPTETTDTPLFHLPVTASSIVVQADANVSESIDRVALVPAPKSDGPVGTTMRARDAARYGNVVAYALDTRVNLDSSGFWVLGWRQPEVIFALDAPISELELELRNVDVPNQVRLWSGAWSTERSMAPNEVWRVRVPTAGLGRAFPIGFRVERGSKGQLGLRVEVPRKVDRTVAVTFDDLPATVAGVVANDVPAVEALTRKLLDHVARHRIPAVGFVNEVQLHVDGVASRDVERRSALLRLWLDAGLELGNHTYSHRDLNTMPLEDFQADVLRGETITRGLMEEYRRKLRYFRHPFLHVGDTLAKRRGFETFLSRHHYVVAPVSVDNDDFVYAVAYAQALRSGDTALADRIATDYLRYMEEVFSYFEDVSRRVVGREIAQILLLHANTLNADRFGALADALVRRGYRFITVAEALEDPAYRLPDDFVGAPSNSWLNHWEITAGRKPVPTPAPPAWISKR